MNELIQIPYGIPERVELRLPDGLTLDQWKAVGRRLVCCKDSLQFWIGDWINYGRGAYGDKYTEAMDAFGDEAKEEGGGYGYNQHTLECFASVAKRVQPSIRIELLSFGHHQVVASKEPEMQAKWLKDALDGDWSVARLNAEIRKAEKVKTTDKAVGSALEGRWTWETWIGEWNRGFKEFVKLAPMPTWSDYELDTRLEFIGGIETKLAEEKSRRIIARKESA